MSLPQAAELRRRAQFQRLCLLIAGNVKRTLIARLNLGIGLSLQLEQIAAQPVQLGFGDTFFALICHCRRLIQQT